MSDAFTSLPAGAQGAPSLLVDYGYIRERLAPLGREQVDEHFLGHACFPKPLLGKPVAGSRRVWLRAAVDAALERIADDLHAAKQVADA